MTITIPETATMNQEPSKDDVLLGRAANVFHHPGNRRYRHIIALNLRRYKEAKTRLDKMVLIRQVTEQVLDGGRVRFLRRDGKSGEWSEVPFRTAQDKVSHALRDGINKPIFAPLMAEEASPVAPTGVGVGPDATNMHRGQHQHAHVGQDMRNPSEMKMGYDPSLHARAEDQRRIPAANADDFKNLPPRSGILPNSLRLGSMSARSATTRAALGNLMMPHQRSTSAPHLLPDSAVMPLPPHHAAMMESRRASLPAASQPQRFVPPPLGMPGLPPSRPMGPPFQPNMQPYQRNVPLNLHAQHQMQHQRKALGGNNAYSELLALKERTQIANHLAETAIRRQILAAQSHHQPITKSFLDGVVQQYRSNAPVEPPNPRQNSRDGSTSTNDTAS